MNDTLLNNVADEIEKALFTALVLNPAVSALVSSRIYPNKIPQKVRMPALAYQQNGGKRDHTMSGPIGMVNSVFDISCESESYSGARALAKAVRQCLDGYKGTVGTVEIGAVFLIDEYDVPSVAAGTDVLTRYAKNLTFVVWFKEAVT